MAPGGGASVERRTAAGVTPARPRPPSPGTRPVSPARVPGTHGGALLHAHAPLGPILPDIAPSPSPLAHGPRPRLPRPVPHLPPGRLPPQDRARARPAPRGRPVVAAQRRHQQRGHARPPPRRQRPPVGRRRPRR